MVELGKGPGVKWSGVGAPKKVSGSRGPAAMSGGKLRSSSGRSPASVASLSSLRGSSGFGAVGRGGGFFFSSLGTGREGDHYREQPAWQEQSYEAVGPHSPVQELLAGSLSCLVGRLSPVQQGGHLALQVRIEVLALLGLLHQVLVGFVRGHQGLQCGVPPGRQAEGW